MLAILFKNPLPKVFTQTLAIALHFLPSRTSSFHLSDLLAELLDRITYLSRNPLSLLLCSPNHEVKGAKSVPTKKANPSRGGDAKLGASSEAARPPKGEKQMRSFNVVGRTRRGAGLLTVVMALTFSVTPAFGQEYPVMDGKLEVSDPGSSGGDGVVESGDKIKISGSGYASGTEVTITLHSTPMFLGAMTASGAGAINGSVTIPADAPPGEHTIKATGPTAGGGILVLSRSVTIVGETSESGSSAGDGGIAERSSSDASLPLTGGNLPVVLGVALIVAGLALAEQSRRRLARRPE